VALAVENEGRPVAGPHPLLEAAVREAGLPPDLSVRVEVRSDMPLGASTGTSAALVVALLGALDALTGRRRPALEVAAAAHRVETEQLALQSGVQDQLCAAVGGICWIEVADYPRATATRLPVPEGFWEELDRRLVLAFLGPHRSSEVHERVIAGLSSGADAGTPLRALRALAARARDAVAAGDLSALGQVMQESTDRQGELAPGIVSAGAREVVDAARRAGALGWKLNGAGGDGGSVTLLAGPGEGARRRLVEAVGELGPPVRLLPVSLSRPGLVVEEVAV
jgi:D-glycero-alpha-D-manno-heptose-7-phosphate kinase